MKEARLILTIARGLIWFVFLASMLLMLLPVSVKSANVTPYIILTLLIVVFAAFSIGKFYAKTLNTSFDLTDLFIKRFNVSNEKMRWIVIGNTLISIVVLTVVGVFFIKHFF